MLHSVAHPSQEILLHVRCRSSYTDAQLEVLNRWEATLKESVSSTGMLGWQLNMRQDLDVTEPPTTADDWLEIICRELDIKIRVLQFSYEESSSATGSVVPVEYPYRLSLLGRLVDDPSLHASSTVHCVIFSTLPGFPRCIDGWACPMLTSLAACRSQGGADSVHLCRSLQSAHPAEDQVSYEDVWWLVCL